MVSVRSNAYYTQEECEKEFTLKAMLELVIIHTDGKNYKLTKNDIESSPKLAECRLIVSPEMIQHLITDLQLHQKKTGRYPKKCRPIKLSCPPHYIS